MNRKERAAEFMSEDYSIAITGHNVLVTQAMKDYAIQKISTVEKFSDRIIDVVIHMDVQKMDHRVDIVMRVNHLKIRAAATSNDMYISIDQAVGKIETQLLRYKDKLHDHQAKGLKAIEMVVNVIRPHLNDDADSINEEIESANQRELLKKYRPHRIVSNHTLPLKTLTVDEAIMKMELSQDHFLLYRSEEDRKLKLIYRKENGNYGVIEPEQ